jgi:glycosyltransferase involved in cell wall biosynthesis
MLDEALSTTPGLDHRHFSWRTALFGRVDVLHVHWPEIFLEGRTWAHRLWRRSRFQLLLWKLAVMRTPIVRTVHNLELPSGLGRWDRRMLTHVRDRASMNIALNPLTSTPGRTSVILHGHYIDWFAGMPRHTAESGRIAFVGLVRRSKGIESLIDAYTQLREHDPTVSIEISGRPTSASMAEEISARASVVPGLTLRLDYLSEPDYAEAVTCASLVVLPYIHMHNSGSVLAALSLDRPVLVPDNDVNRALSAEVGAGWVHLFEGTVSASDIEAAIGAGVPATPPDLSQRGWRETGIAHLTAYRAAVAGRSRR